MRTLASLGCVGMLVVSIAVACAGDDAKHVRDGEGGGAGRDEGGAAGFGQGAGQSDPMGGAGSPSGGVGATEGGGMGGMGGVPETNGEGGTGAPSPGSDGGAGGAINCPAPEDKNYACAEVAANWAPVWNTFPGRFEFDVSSLPLPIASGTVSYFYNNSDFQECGTVPVQVNGDLIFAVPDGGNLKLTPTDARVTTFSLVDVCGNRHDFDPTGVPQCTDLRGDGFSGSWPLTCSTRLDASCPEACIGN